MLTNLRRYDVQATYACGLAFFSALPCLAAAILTVQRYHHDLGQIVYGSKGMFLPGLLGCLLASMLLSGIGLLLGLNSAGQRRNDKPKRSWLGFFLGGSILSLNIILLLAFYMLRLERPM
ncbi:MAG: hypothetical protein AABZ47_18665 [Planctomycetota bacterium]